MKKLLEFLIENVTGSKNFNVEEISEDDGVVKFEVKIDPQVIGLIIGKGGKTIKNIRRILSIKAVTEKKNVRIEVNPL
ncbi:MAG: KH domain-containing protein [Candidatus Woesebacteria bacterium]|nr:MAG: KH domain-containing protein [Candidatus Woesebacteria bacterium]